MKIHRRNIKYKYRRIGVGITVFIVALSLVLVNLPRAQASQLNKKYSFIKTNYTVPTSNVAWVAPNGNDTSGNGSEGSPYATFKKALSSISNGGTVVAKSGIYREPHFFISGDNVTIQAAPGAEVWLKGSDVVNLWTSENGIWKTTGNYHNFCHVCTTNANPSVEGVAAYPEQVFINDEPLKQVKTKAEVTPGSNTFYVEDNTPTTLKTPNNNADGYNIGQQDAISYYIGKNPASGVTEISERARAFTSTGKNVSVKGINVAQYSPVQVWGFKDPYDPAADRGVYSGPTAVSINGTGSLVQDMIVTQSASQGLFFNKAESSTARGVKAIDNGGSGVGANKSHNTVFTNGELYGNNAEGFLTIGCGAYCTMADIKVTHTRNFTFRNNIVDYSRDTKAYSTAANANSEGMIGFWCDEGCVETKIVGNFFTNSPLAIMYEVSGNGIIASNIIESSGTGIRVAGSDDVKVYNNTISRTYRPIYIFEDSRVDGCNYWKGGSCVANESWSQGLGLDWNTSGVELYNNIISSRPLARAEDLSGGNYQRAYSLRVEGSQNDQNRPYVDANDMLKGFDYNVYYRNESDDINLSVWDFKQIPSKTDTVISRASDIANNPKLSNSIDGRDAHSLDTFGSRANNPYFVKEAVNNNDYKKSNYNLKPGSPAINKGKPLSSDVAQAIDPTGKTVKAGVPVNAGALVNVLMDATGGQTPPTPPVTVNIPDAGLKAAINKTLDSNRPSTQDITVDELAQLTQLTVDGGVKVKNLTGLEKATNLQELKIDNNEVADLAPLSSLAKLTKLTMTNNKVASIEPLAHLANLSVLLASGNPITSTKPLANLTHLTQVSVDSKSTAFDISDFAKSAGTLTTLQLSGADNGTPQLVHSEVLKQLTKVTTLQVSSTSLTDNDLNSIGAMTQLTSLQADRSNISDMSFAGRLTKLTKLDVSNQRIRMSTNTTPFASPLKGVSGTAVAITNSADLANDGAGRVKIVSPIYDNNAHELSATWTKNVTVSAATAQFNGQLTVSATLPKADKAQLQAQIDRANNSADYIKADAAVASALSAAKNVVAKPNPTPAEISQATNDLKQALDAAIAKETAAQAAARTAVDKAKNSKSPADIRAAEALLAHVQDAAKKSAMQDELNAVKQEITDARTALSKLIDKAKNTPTDGLAAETVAALNTAIAAAKAVNNDQESTVAQLTEAKTKLQSALDNLKTDKTALAKAIADADKEPVYIKNDSAVKTALQHAKNVYAAANPTPAEVNTAVNNLKSAIDAAKKKETDAQAAAANAVATAEGAKTAQSITAAQTLVDAVQDASVKSALQARLDAVSQQLSNAKQTLGTLITKAEAVDTTGMSADTVNALKAKIKQAKQVYNDASASVMRLQTAASELQAALDALRPDKTTLRDVIARAEAQPAYIRNDPAVKSALQHAKNVEAAASSTPADISSAIQQLNSAITAAQKKEADAQAVAQAAVADAESQKTAQSIAHARTLVDKVQDQTVKASLRARLDAIVVQNFVNKQTIRQANNTNITLSTSGDKCYNIKNATAVGQPKNIPTGYQMQGSAKFTINCDGHAQPAVGYTTKITLELSRIYKVNRLKVIKYSINGANATDITEKVAFKTSADGKRTIVEYSITDGGFGDMDKTANGVIDDPVIIYERSENNTTPANGGNQPGAPAKNGKATANGGRLSETGDSLYGYIIGAGVLVLGGAAGVYAIIRRRQ